MDNSSFSVMINFDGLKTVQIDNKDVYHCGWLEDIYSYGTIGKLVLFDSYGLKEYGPLTGDETIALLFGEDGAEGSVYSIIKISGIEGVNEFNQSDTSVITVYFSELYYRDLVMKRFSNSWSKTKVSDIVTNIVDEFFDVDLTEVEIEPSDKELEYFTMPYWTPAEALRWLIPRAKGTRGRCNYGYLFYSSTRKMVNFVTLDNLLNNAETDPDIYKFSSTSDTIINYDNRILSWKQRGVDQLGIREFGGGALLGFDPNTKEFIGFEEDETFIFSKAVKDITTLGNASLFDGNTIDPDFTKFSYTYDLTGEGDKEIIKNIFYNNFIKRYSLQNMVKIIVTGTHSRYVGMKVNVQWPSMSPEEVYNSMDSGMYLIKSIWHSFTPLYTPIYTQCLTLMKNAYQDNKFGNTSGSGGYNQIQNFQLGMM